MTEIKLNCITSGYLNTSSSFVHDVCVIDIVEIIDTTHVSVKVYPLYEGMVEVTLLKDQQTNFRQFQKPFRITITSMYHSDIAEYVVLEVCELEEVVVDKCAGVVCDDVCTEEGHLVIRECDPFLGICQSVETIKDAPECISPGGKEMVFPFSKDITAFWENDTVRSCVTKIVKALGGKSAYLEDGTKIVVVL